MALSLHFMHSDPVSIDFVTRATTPEESKALKHEAQMLARAAQPGVIKLASLTVQGNDVTLSLAPLRGELLQDATVDIHQLANIMVSVGMVVSRLHESEIAHGSLSSDAIIISAKSGKPILRNFAESIVTTQRADFVRDIRDLVEILNEQLARIPPNPAPHIARLRSRLIAIVNATQKASDRNVPDATTLARLIRHATQQNLKAKRSLGKEAQQRLTAIRRSISGATPSEKTARLKGASQSARRSPIRSSIWPKFNLPHPLSLPIFGGFVFVGTGIFLLLGFGLYQLAAAHEAPKIDPTLRTCPNRPNSTLTVDVDGDGCGDAIELGDTTVKVNDELFTVGNPGDQLALGRWSCDNKYALAVARPTTGQIFVFDSWPERGKDALPQEVTRVRGVEGLSPVSFGNCDRIAVKVGPNTITIDPRASRADRNSTSARGSSRMKQHNQDRN